MEPTQKPPKVVIMANQRIPMDILATEILPKQPVKSIVRFKCVSKYFRTLISSRKFIDHHLSLSHSSNCNDTLIIKEYARLYGPYLYTFNLDTPGSSATKLPLLPLYTTIRSVVGSCNGLLCFLTYNNSDSLNYRCLLLNPSTRSYREILLKEPSSRCTYSLLGFGYDHLHDDYKVLLLCDIDNIDMVYSLRSNSWRSISINNNNRIVGISPVRIPNQQEGVVINTHLLHWLIVLSVEREKYRIVCFDICSEQWEDDIPFSYFIQDKKECRKSSPCLGVLDGCLCVLISTPDINIWMMKEYGVESSWMKLFNVSHLNDMPVLRYFPLHLRRGSNLQILLKVDSDYEIESSFTGLEWYNIRDRTTEKMEIHGISPCCSAYYCKASLISIPGGQQIEEENELN